jgi:2-polyprenyl-6-methoxyphenol hydroxylase-like FAD-dependent oxidoreductase
VRSLGAGIVSWPNASFVLEALGVWPYLRPHATPVHTMQRLTDSGEALGSIDVRQIDAALGYPSLAVLRHDLMQALRERALALGVQLRYGQRLQAMEALAPHGPGATRLVFEGGEAVQPDWVLGAEGRMHAISRAFVLGAAQAPPQYQGFVNWIGVCDTPEPAFTPGTVLDYWGTGERFGVVALSAQRAYWAGGAAMPLGQAEPARYRAELQARFGHWPAPVQAALRGTPDTGIHQVFLHDHAPTGPWQRANVLLLGDAAHAPLPTSGQGACQALEDAWHLAQSLQAHGDDVPGAWAQFVQQRQPKAYGIVQAGRHLAQGIFHTPPEGVARRNQAARDADYSALARGMAQAWGQGLPLRHH